MHGFIKGTIKVKGYINKNNIDNNDDFIYDSEKIIFWELINLNLHKINYISKINIIIIIFTCQFIFKKF